jgi:prepilin-type N-terminal cleavage/methylation domain-containing protein/prepilin-type processing-associated H-X9-DG protein
MRIRKAFTLIELLVVISVIAILLAILMPALTRARDLGRRIVCANHIRILALANTLYADDSDGWYVPIIDRTWGNLGFWPLNQHFRRMVGDAARQEAGDGVSYAPKQFRCPSDPVANQERRFSMSGTSCLCCPDDVGTYRYTFCLSYGYNLTDWHFTDWLKTGYAAHKTMTVPSPASRLVFTESNDWRLHWKGANYAVGWDVLGHDTTAAYEAVLSHGSTLYRHAEGVNVAFYDGHVEHRKKDKVWSQADWDAGQPGMWSVFRTYPPTEADKARLHWP